MAGMLLVAVAFLPPTLVLTLSANGGLEGLQSPKQVVPFALARSAGGLRPAAGDALLLALSAAALGSGAAILRAMAQALASAVPKWRDAGHPAYGVLALAVGALIAARGQGIVDTMVSVNVVYIASIGWVFVLLLRGVVLTVRQASAIMGVGFAVSMTAYGAGWAGWLRGDADSVSLAAGLLVSAAAALVCAAPRCRSVRP